MAALLLESPVKREKPQAETVKPKIVKPETVKQKIVKPEIVKPKIVKPKIVKPKSVKPEIVKPESVKPKIVTSDIVKPKIVKTKVVKQKAAPKGAAIKSSCHFTNDDLLLKATNTGKNVLPGAKKWVFKKPAANKQKTAGKRGKRVASRGGDKTERSESEVFGKMKKVHAPGTRVYIQYLEPDSGRWYAIAS